MTAGLALLILGITRAEQLVAGDGQAASGGRFGSGELASTAVPLAGAVVLLAAFVAVERRKERDDRAPLVPFSILRNSRPRCRRSGWRRLPVGLGALLFLGTQHLQTVLGFSAWETGLAYLALSLPVVAASPVAAWLVDRLGRRTAAAGGLVLQAGGLLTMTGASADGAFASDVLPAFLLVGVGAPVAFVALTGAAVDDVGERSGLASGLFSTAQQVGKALALALLAAVTAAFAGPAARLSAGSPEAESLVAGLRAGFAAAAGLCILGALVSLRLRSQTADMSTPPRQLTAIPLNDRRSLMAMGARLPHSELSRLTSSPSSPTRHPILLGVG